MSNIEYSDADINEFIEVSQEMGIGRAMRHLGYPKSWSTAQRWHELRGTTPAVDELKARSKAFHDWYQTEEVLLTAQEGMNRVYEDLVNNPLLSPDDQKKLAEAFMKHFNVWNVAQGKASSISETRSTDTVDSELRMMLDAAERANRVREQEAGTETT